MKKLTELLNSEKSLSGWRICQTSTDSYELFFVHEKLETTRAASAVNTSVTVYVDHDGAKGDSTFSVYKSMSKAELKEKIAQAARRALLVNNQPYELCGAGKEETALPTNLSSYDEKELAAMIARDVFTADRPQGCSINALEVFLYKDVFRVVTSRGVDKTQTTRRVMIEAIPTFTDEKESVELYEDYRFTVYDKDKLQKEISEKLREVRDRRLARKPETPLKINVVLRPQEIRELLMEYAYYLNYSLVYTHANLHKTGDDLQPGDGCDKLTLTLCAAIPGSERSASFDEDGTALRDTTVIENGVVKDYFGSSRFGQYLGVKTPSGDLRCGRLAAGTLTERELKSAPYLECASMSGLQIDLYNDYIGGEIRLAYYFDGEKTVPVTGISMSGRLSDTLKALRLSKETDSEGAYEGPVKMLLPGMEIL